MIISFGYTAEALLAGAQSVTRRAWSVRTVKALFNAQERQRRQDASRWPRCRCDAYDTSPRIGGKRIGAVDVFALSLEPIAQMPDSDYEAEGFAWLHANGHVPPKSAPFRDFSRASFEAWRASGAMLWVVRFELVERVAA